MFQVGAISMTCLSLSVCLCGSLPLYHAKGPYQSISLSALIWEGEELSIKCETLKGPYAKLLRDGAKSMGRMDSRPRALTRG